MCSNMQKCSVLCLCVFRGRPSRCGTTAAHSRCRSQRSWSRRRGCSASPTPAGTGPPGTPGSPYSPTPHSFCTLSSASVSLRLPEEAASRSPPSTSTPPSAAGAPRPPSPQQTSGKTPPGTVRRSGGPDADACVWDSSGWPPCSSHRLCISPGWVCGAHGRAFLYLQPDLQPCVDQEVQGRGRKEGAGHT